MKLILKRIWFAGLLFSLIFIAACSTTTVHITTDSFPDGRKQVEETQEIKKRIGPDDTTTVKRIIYYSSGQVRQEQSFRRGYDHGAWITYFPNGEIDSLITYSYDYKTGVYRKGTPEGEWIITGEFMFGKRHGTWTWFNGKADPDSVLTYENGELNGLWEEYYSNGQLREKCSYFAGVRQGDVIRWHTNGKVALKGRYTSGLRHDEWTWTGADKLRDSVRVYDFGKLEGKQLTYDDDGQLEVRIEFQQDQPQGEAWTYYPSGQASSFWTYVSGQRHGPFRYWFREGSVEEDGTYHRDKPDGHIRRYFPTGGISSHGMYADGQLHGRLRVYFPSGELSKEAFYVHDTLICEILYHENGRMKSVTLYNVNGTTRWNYRWTAEGASATSMENMHLEETYFENGNPRTIIMLKNDTKHGIERQYNPGRRLREFVIYQDGEPWLIRTWLEGSDTPRDFVLPDGELQVIVPVEEE